MLVCIESSFNFGFEFSSNTLSSIVSDRQAQKISYMIPSVDDGDGDAAVSEGTAVGDEALTGIVFEPYSFPTQPSSAILWRLPTSSS